jgi:hypothetical protein
MGIYSHRTGVWGAVDGKLLRRDLTAKEDAA